MHWLEEVKLKNRSVKLSKKDWFYSVIYVNTPPKSFGAGEMETKYVFASQEKD